MAIKVCASHSLDREPDCAGRTAVLEQAEALCHLWEETAVVLPSHSRLYFLEPIGVGSPFVESLTSYITRLAEAHSISIRALIADEISPLWKQIATSHKGHLDRHYLKTFLRVSMVLNGSTAKTSDMVQALEQLTLRQDLRFLTMLTWRNVLSTRKLLKRARAWCPLCYEEWREKGQIVYEPLIWTLEDVSICPGHRSQLHTRCPYTDCHLSQPPLASHSQPGFCSRCSRWLGIPLQSQGERRCAAGNKEREWEQWKVNAVGELLSNAPSLSIEPQRERILSSINKYAEKLTGGKMLKLLNQVQYSPRAITSWLYEGVEPQLGSLLHFCFDLGASPLRLLIGEVEEKAVA
jgi:TniQ